MTRLLNVDIPLNIIEKCENFALLSISPVFKYDAVGNKTDVQVAWRYNVANADSFERYSIKVVSDLPIIDANLLKTKRALGEKSFVKFTNAVIKMYRANNGEFCDSIKADFVDFVE